jgi:hypothetical protein
MVVVMVVVAATAVRPRLLGLGNGEPLELKPRSASDDAIDRAQVCFAR